MRELKSRHSKKYDAWRLNVFERDLFKCQSCGTDKNLCAHHIVEWDDSKELRYELSNGLTVCRGCHLKIHWQDECHGMGMKKHSDEAKYKMHLAKVGKPSALRGRKVSDEIKKKLSLAKLGKKRGPISETTRERMSKAHSGKKQKPHSQETKIKMSNAQKIFWVDKESIYAGKTWYNCPKTGKRIWTE
jgi:hypothetical protein